MVKLRLFVLLLVGCILASASFNQFYNHGSSTAWTYIINMDGRGYYAYLPAVFIHNDPTYDFHLQYNAQHDDNINFTHELEDGRRVNKYFVGEAVLLAPFFFTAHAVALVTHFEPNGYSLPYYISVAFAAIFYVVLGLWFLSSFLLRIFKIRWVSLVVPLFILLGTNLFYYAAYEPSMSHAYSFFLVCCFLYVAEYGTRSSSTLPKLLLGLTIGLIAITRPVNLVILGMLPFILVRDKDLPTLGFTRTIKILTTTSLPVVAIIFIQLLAYKWQTGQWLVYSYQGEGFNWAEPQIINTLFSYKRGLFVYAPICLISLFGLKQLWKQSSVMTISLAATLMAAIYVVSSWHAWDYGWAYGLRAYVEFLPLFAIVMAAFLASAKPKFKMVFAVVALLCVAYTQIQTYQVAEKILPLAGVEKQEFWNIFLQL